MTPQEILDALINGKEVKVTDELLKELGVEKNVFTIYQIEYGSVNIYTDDEEEVFHDISFNKISLI